MRRILPLAVFALFMGLFTRWRMQQRELRHAEVGKLIEGAQVRAREDKARRRAPVSAVNNQGPPPDPQKQAEANRAAQRYAEWQNTYGAACGRTRSNLDRIATFERGTGNRRLVLYSDLTARVAKAVEVPGSQVASARADAEQFIRDHCTPP